jgi:hypothetical protein
VARRLTAPLILVITAGVLGWAHPGFRALALMRIGQHVCIACAAAMAGFSLTGRTTLGVSQRWFWWLGTIVFTAGLLLLWLYLSRNPQVSFNTTGAVIRAIVLTAVPFAGVYLVTQPRGAFSMDGLTRAGISFLVAMAFAPIAVITGLYVLAILTGEGL